MTKSKKILIKIASFICGVFLGTSLVRFYEGQVLTPSILLGISLTYITFMLIIFKRNMKEAKIKDTILRILNREI